MRAIMSTSSVSSSPAQSSPPQGYVAELIDATGQAWNRFWFTPSDPLPCGVLRIAVGTIVVLHLAILSGQLDTWYAASGILLPDTVPALLGVGPQDLDPRWTYFDRLGPLETRGAHALALLVAVAFTVGLFTRVTGVLTLLALLAYFHRIPMLAAHVEPLLIFLVAYLSIGPAGERLSVSRWIRSRQQSETTVPPRPTPWATLSLRLIQVHFAAFVAMMGVVKLNGDAWWLGEGIWYLIARTHSRPLDLSGLRNAELVVNFWTHAVVYFELAFPILIWNRWARPILILLGAAIWCSLILVTGMWVFALALVAAMGAYIPAETYRRWLGVRA
jgi:hypothetical protein